MNQILQYELKWQKNGEKQYSVIYCRNAKVHHCLQQNRKNSSFFTVLSKIWKILRNKVPRILQ